MARPVWWLALRDLGHEWRASLVTVMAVAVALAPLLILFGLWFGVVETMRARLASDPANLELRHRPVEALEPGLFAALRAREEVGFVVERTRYVNLQLRAVNRDDLDAPPAELILVPTAPGDPVLARAGIAVPEGDAVVLSSEAAERLRLSEGGTATLALGRIGTGGRRERAALPLAVAGVLPPGAAEGLRAYAPLAVLRAVQDYQEWVRVERHGWPGQDRRGDAWGGFRLYAATLDDVEPLRRWLVGQGFDVISAADRIAFTRRVDRDLGRLFAVVLALTGTGFAATLWLTQVAAVERKRRVLAVLRLIGYGPRAVGSFPVVQGAALALAGSLLAVIVYLAVEPVIGALFRDLVETDGRLTRLPAAAAGTAVAASVGVAMMASLGAARRATRISPAESLRDA